MKVIAVRKVELKLSLLFQSKFEEHLGTSASGSIVSCETRVHVGMIGFVV